MDLMEIKKRVNEIRELADEDDFNEDTHIREDELYLDFVKYIAKTGNKKQREMARAALEAESIQYNRCYA